MLKTLASHNEDLSRLLEKGFALAVDSNCLLVRDIPYLDDQKQLKWGATVSKLVFEDQVRVRAENHVVFFAGPRPCGLDGSAIRGLGGGPATYQLSDQCNDVVVQQSFSHKLKDGTSPRDYVDHYEKINNYVAMISGPAMSLHNVDPYTFKDYEEEVPNSVFKLRDTLTSRAEIGALAKQFENDVVAVVGLGGTGSYVLDFLVKTPVREIRGFDPDHFFVHNAFRSPGRLDPEGNNELRQLKSVVYQARYEEFRHGVSIKPHHIDETSGQELQGVTFAFVCVDKGSSRKRIIDLLNSMNIPFIDVGMGLKRKSGPISGTVRATYFPIGEGQAVRDKQYVPESDPADDEYKANIQIAELNALNACLAVLRFKQLRGFYVGPHDAINQLFTLDNLSLSLL